MLRGSHNGTSAIPSHGCLQVLRNLALSRGTTNHYCTNAGFTYRIPRKTLIAVPKLHRHQRPFRSSAYVHDATLAAQRLASSQQTAAEVAVVREEDSTHASLPSPHEDRKTMRQVKKMQDLLDHQKPIEAAQIFLEVHPASLPGITVGKRQVAQQIFFANIEADNALIAKNVFDRLAVVDQVTRLMWEALIVAMAQRGYIETVATVYMRFRQIYYVPSELVDIILRCLIETRRLTTAKHFLYRNLQRDRSCGLIGTFLRGMWKRTRSLELLDSQAQRILTLLDQLGRKPTEKFFNPVILAYIEVGRKDEAEALVQDMQMQYGISISCRTRGLLVFQKAIRCEWDAVMRDLEEMHADGLTRQARDFAIVYDRVLREYWLAHSGSEIRDFVVRAIEKYELVPDDVLYRLILEAYIEKGDMNMVDEFVQMGRNRSWKVECTEDELLHMLRARRRKLERSPAGAWGMLRAARSNFRQASSSLELLGYDRDSFPLGTVHRMPNSDELMAAYQRKIQMRASSRSVDQYQTLELQMAHFMHVGKLDIALKCFVDARNAEFRLKRLQFELATVATLLLHGIGEAKAITREHWSEITGGVWRDLPIFFQQVMGVGEDADEGELIKMGVFHFYNLCDQNPQLHVKHHIVNAMSRRMILQNQPQRAQDLLVSVYKSKFVRVQRFSGTCMKMFVRAFAAQENLYGVRWCLVSTLARTSALTREMVVEAYRVMAQLASRFRESGDEAVHRKLAFLDHVTALMTKKSMGELSVPFQVDRNLKRSARRVTDRWHMDDAFAFNADRLGEMVERWDEEYELAIVLGEIEWEKPKIVARWREAKVLEDQWQPLFDMPATDEPFFDIQAARG